MGIASRHVEGGGVSDWALGRRIISRGAQLIGFCLLPEVIGRISDPMSGFFMIRRTSIEGRELSPLGYKILIEVLGRGNVKWIAEVPYTFRERVEGASKLTNKIYLEYFQHLLRLRLYLLQASSFVRFCVVGASGVVIDMSILYLLSDPSTLHWGLTRSKFVAAEAALMNNFIWNDMWTFGDISREQKTMGQRVKRFLKFNANLLDRNHPEYFDSQYRVQLFPHEPLHREPCRDRFGHTVELQIEQGVQLARHSENVTLFR